MIHPPPSDLGSFFLSKKKREKNNGGGNGLFSVFFLEGNEKVKQKGLLCNLNGKVMMTWRFGGFGDWNEG